MTTSTLVWVTARFAALHRWPDAPAAQAFLRDFHRHVFHVQLWVEVTHGDRQVEFFALKEKLMKLIVVEYAGKYTEKSCEHMAAEIAEAMDADSCEVSEDGENGAIVYRRKT